MFSETEIFKGKKEENTQWHYYLNSLVTQFTKAVWLHGCPFRS